MKYLDELNNAQKEAVLHTEGPLLILAGAGAGKTKTITHRILHLITGGVRPDQILAVTFTNKAAKEMGERMRKLLGLPDSEAHHGPFMSTFHTLGTHILRAHARDIGRNRFFTILDRDEAIRLVKKAMDSRGIDKKQFDPKKILGSISKEKGNGLNVHIYNGKINNYWQEIVGSVWTEYEKLTAKNNSLDFDDLLLQTVSLLYKNDQIKRLYRDRWPYIHIDEYQDTNKVQYSLANLLCSDQHNICVVGDIDQSIYSWRGADYTNIMRFEEDFPNTKVVLLEQNYRSTQNILDVANIIIAKNVNRKDKKLFTENEAGAKLNLYSAFDENDEGQFIASTIKTEIDNGTLSENIAVLYRANFQSRAIEEALLKKNIPYQVLGIRFFERKEIKDILAYLQASLDPDNLDAVLRIINTPKRGLGKATLAKIASGDEASLPPATRQKINDFRSLLNKFKNDLSDRPLAEIIKDIFTKSGLEKELLTEGDDGLERIDNIKELVSLSQKYNHLTGEEAILSLLDEASLVSDQDTLKEDKKGVRLMTVHASKGLEFDTVFITGLEQNLFPHQAFASDEHRDDEEERRLFYVAVTRARKKLFLTYAQMRTIFGSKQMNMPSEFILDIPADFIDSNLDSDVPKYEYLLDF